MTAASVNVVSHPLVQHKLTLMRQHDRSIKSFRELVNEIGTLLCYEVTRDLPLELVDIETPLMPMKAPMISGKKLTLAPILRAGVGFLDGMLALVPSARVAHIGLYRDPADVAGGRILLQGAAGSVGSHDDPDGSDAGNRQFRLRGCGACSSRVAPVTSGSFACWPRRRGLRTSSGSIRTFRSGRLPSTKG